MKIAVYAGSFDPVTAGHLSVVRQAAALFDHVRVLIAVNPQKQTLFTPSERVALVRTAVARLPNVSVDFTDGLVVVYAQEIGASVLVRGVRGLTDAGQELALAQLNHELNPAVATVLLPSDPALSAISSSDLKARARRGENIDAFCPAEVAAVLRRKMEVDACQPTL